MTDAAGDPAAAPALPLAEEAVPGEGAVVLGYD